MKIKSLLKTVGVVMGAALAAGLLVACSDGGPEDHSAHTAGAASSSDEAFREDMRALWEDHIAWTRLAIVSIAEDLPDAAATTDRLLRNQVDIGDAVKPYYGNEAGDQLTALLKDHIVIAADLVTAAKAGDGDGVQASQSEWYANADAVGAFLATANPENWEADEMQAMMREHLDLTLQEAVSYLQGDHAASIGAYDEIHVQILGMADMLSAGIIEQFPDAFVAQGVSK